MHGTQIRHQQGMMRSRTASAESVTLSISRFNTFIIGANRPVGHFLSRALAAQNLMYKGVGLESREKLSLLAPGKPFLVILPSLFHTDDYAQVPFWLEQAEEEDIPVLLLSSLAVFPPRTDKPWHEDETSFSEQPLAQDLLTIEALARRNRRHLILRIGQGFSLMNEDFANHVLTLIREQSSLWLDMQQKFSPTAADDVADILVAMLKQANCCDDLWGTYHFSGVEPVSSYMFAEALLAEAGQYEDLSGASLNSQENGLKPAIWAPSGDNTLLFHSFGIKPRAWRKGLSRLVRRYYRADT